ncbi:MAG: hypothetical protein ACK5LQ_13575, partial [Planctomycetota bacterium]
MIAILLGGFCAQLAVAQESGRNTIRALMASRQTASSNQEPTVKDPQAKPAAAGDSPSANPTNPDSSAISVEAVAAQLQQLQSASDLDANLKQTLTTTYEAVLAETKKRIEEDKAIKDYQSALEAAPGSTTEAKRRKEKPDFKSVYFDGSLTWSNLDRLQAFQLDANAMLQAAAKNRTDT